eukprot:1951706-Amphidinium_carterae.1
MQSCGSREAVVGIGNVQLRGTEGRVIVQNTMHRGTHASGATLNSKSEKRRANILFGGFEPSLSGQSGNELSPHGGEPQ